MGLIRFLVASVVLLTCQAALGKTVFADTFQPGWPVQWYTYPTSKGVLSHQLELPRTQNHTPDCVNPPGCSPDQEPRCPCNAAWQFEHDSVHCSWQRDEALPANRQVRYSVWFLDLLYRTDPNQIHFVHFQVQGWITLLDVPKQDHFVSCFNGPNRPPASGCP